MDIKLLRTRQSTESWANFCQRIEKPTYWLRGANLWEADLQGANLREAHLWEADLRRANLRRANLQGANLEGTNLEGANLEGACLWGANLREAHLQGANLEGANLWEASLEGANLREASLRYADFQKANLEGVDLELASNMMEANFERARLEGANQYVSLVNQYLVRKMNLQSELLRVHRDNPSGGSVVVDYKESPAKKTVKYINRGYSVSLGHLTIDDGSKYIFYSRLPALRLGSPTKSCSGACVEILNKINSLL